MWVYPFMNYLNPFTFIVFAAATFCWNGLLYIIGKGLAYWRWKGMTISELMDNGVLIYVLHVVVYWINGY